MTEQVDEICRCGHPKNEHRWGSMHDGDCRLCACEDFYVPPQVKQVKDQSREAAWNEFTSYWDLQGFRVPNAVDGFNAGWDSALAAANQCVSVDKIAEIVHDALNEYRCLHYLDHDGSGLGLVDRLSPDDDTTITRGTEELAALEDYIMGEIADAYQPKEQGEPS